MDLLTGPKECGAHFYWPFNNTIHFMVTGGDCLVRVLQRNSLVLTTRLEVDYDDFFSSSKKIDFENKYYAFMSTRAGLDMSKFKVVGYARGSVIR